MAAQQSSNASDHSTQSQDASICAEQLVFNAECPCCHLELARSRLMATMVCDDTPQENSLKLKRSKSWDRFERTLEAILDEEYLVIDRTEFLEKWQLLLLTRANHTTADGTHHPLHESQLVGYWNKNKTDDLPRATHLSFHRYDMANLAQTIEKVEFPRRELVDRPSPEQDKPQRYDSAIEVSQQSDDKVDDRVVQAKDPKVRGKDNLATTALCCKSLCRSARQTIRKVTTSSKTKRLYKEFCDSDVIGQAFGGASDERNAFMKDCEVRL